MADDLLITTKRIIIHAPPAIDRGEESVHEEVLREGIHHAFPSFNYQPFNGKNIAIALDILRHTQNVIIDRSLTTPIHFLDKFSNVISDYIGYEEFLWACCNGLSKKCDFIVIGKGGDRRRVNRCEAFFFAQHPEDTVLNPLRGSESRIISIEETPFYYGKNGIEPLYRVYKTFYVKDVNKIFNDCRNKSVDSFKLQFSRYLNYHLLFYSTYATLTELRRFCIEGEFNGNWEFMPYHMLKAILHHCDDPIDMIVEQKKVYWTDELEILYNDIMMKSNVCKCDRLTPTLEQEGNYMTQIDSFNTDVRKKKCGIKWHACNDDTCQLYIDCRGKLGNTKREYVLRKFKEFGITS